MICCFLSEWTGWGSCDTLVTELMKILWKQGKALQKTHDNIFEWKSDSTARNSIAKHANVTRKEQNCTKILVDVKAVDGTPHV